MKYAAAVIGVSLGGLNALRKILPALPKDFKLPLIIVQHVGASSDGYWIEKLNEISTLNIKEADEKEPIEKGTVYIAPPNYHLLVEPDHTLSLSADKRVNFARPSIDVLFESAAHVFRDKLIGIVLTGSNNDGAKGLKKIKAEGGLAIVEDPSTAESPSMPKAALKAIKADYVLSLNKITNLLLELEKL